MNLGRITELINLISRLYATLRDLISRKGTLEGELPIAESAPMKMDSAAASAKNRVTALSSFGFRAEFLEDIILPVQNAPDSSGIGVTVKKEISETEGEIQQTNSKIAAAEQEKVQLEMEEA